MIPVTQFFWKSLITGDVSKQADSTRQERTPFNDLRIIMRNVRSDEIKKKKENNMQ